MTQTTYRNPWYKPNGQGYGPAEYTTTAQPNSYRGFLIYQRIPGHVWDIVKNGLCVSQYAGPNGARRFIDSLEGGVPTRHAPYDPRVKYGSVRVTEET